MKKSRFTDSQILAVLKQAEGGAPVVNLLREHGISNATFYKWRAKYGGMDASLMARMKELEDENRRLKKMYAEEKLKAEIVMEALEKKVVAPFRRKAMVWMGSIYRTPCSCSLSCFLLLLQTPLLFKTLWRLVVDF